MKTTKWWLSAVTGEKMFDRMAMVNYKLYKLRWCDKIWQLRNPIIQEHCVYCVHRPIVTVYSIHDQGAADLDGGPPDGLHGQGDEAGDGVRDGEVVHQVVHVCPHSEKKLNYKMIE